MKSPAEEEDNATGSKVILIAVLVGAFLIIIAAGLSGDPRTATTVRAPITGVSVPPAVGDDPPETPREAQWWIARASLTECIETNGPAAKLDDFVGTSDKPSTEDFSDSRGTLVKVNVVNAATNGMTSFYRNKATCEAEQINATKALADRYR